MKVYIAGPITGIPNNNRRAFDAAVKHLREGGRDPVSPAELEEKIGAGHPWQVYMNRALSLMLDCEAVFVLPGWQRSRGASLEVYVATQIALPVHFAPLWDDFLPEEVSI